MNPRRTLIHLEPIRTEFLVDLRRQAFSRRHFTAAPHGFTELARHPHFGTRARCSVDSRAWGRPGTHWPTEFRHRLAQPLAPGSRAPWPRAQSRRGRHHRRIRSDPAALPTASAAALTMHSLLVSEDA